MFHILVKDENITVEIIEDEKSDIEPNDSLQYDIIYEDEDMIIINKPSDRPVR